MTNIGKACSLRGFFFGILALTFLLMAALVASPVEAQTGTAVTAPTVEIVEDEDLGVFTRFTEY